MSRENNHSKKRRFRFAPSPTGRLHLGHAYAALVGEAMASEAKGAYLLRIEDIDHTRCTPANADAILEDLDWLGIKFDAPARFQSVDPTPYQAAFDRLMAQGLLYPCFCSRKDIAASGAQMGPLGLVYRGTCKGMTAQQIEQQIGTSHRPSYRLDLAKALKLAPQPRHWTDHLMGKQSTDWHQIGDVIVWRKDIDNSYHLSVVVDDALDAVTDIVRGADLLDATPLHMLLCDLLGLPQARYHHHGLLMDVSGQKLAKTRDSKSLADLRASGLSAREVRHLALQGPMGDTATQS